MTTLWCQPVVGNSLLYYVLHKKIPSSVHCVPDLSFFRQPFPCGLFVFGVEGWSLGTYVFSNNLFIGISLSHVSEVYSKSFILSTFLLCYTRLHFSYSIQNRFFLRSRFTILTKLSHNFHIILLSHAIPSLILSTIFTCKLSYIKNNIL